jgi:hypothetical protein
MDPALTGFGFIVLCVLLGLAAIVWAGRNR